MIGFELFIDVHDVSNKYVDTTKTTTRLVLKNPIGHETVIAFVHSNNTIEEVLQNKKEYEKLLLTTIKENMNWKE